MFRRRWSGLPAEPKFEPDLKKLGYFVNEDDEIRDYHKPDFYFKYFLTKNMRYNDCQRFVFNLAVGNIVDSRLAAEGLKEVLLPLGVTSKDEPHVKIRLSKDMADKSRVVIIVGQSFQDFGILAHRVASGAGGLNKGSLVDMVRAIKQQKSSATDDAAPGIILANPGQLWWWPEGKMAVSEFARHQVPGSSLVHWGYYHDPERNTVPENETPADHVKYIFEKVVPQFVTKDDAKIDVIALGDMSDEVEQYLDDDKAWAKIGHKMNSMVVLGGFYDMRESRCQGFKKFMDERGRAYIHSQEPLDTLIAGPEGGDASVTGYVGYGCPTYSVGPEAAIMELILIEAGSAVLKWLQQVALDKDYVNERVNIPVPEKEPGMDNDEFFGWNKDGADGSKDVSLKEIMGDGVAKGVDHDKEAGKILLTVAAHDYLQPPKDETVDQAIDRKLAEEIARRVKMAEDGIPDTADTADLDDED